MKKYLTYTDDKSSKFWSIETNGSSYTVVYGRIGATGTTQTKAYGSAEAAEAEATKLLASKLKKGYVEGNASDMPAAASATKKVMSTAAPDS
ncbi:MAG: WGR domain-containing protein, partial [Deferribacteraceae bacterium]|nr:WGR domain-containing protein [Deferribacteraceae bacterium]